MAVIGGSGRVQKARVCVAVWRDAYAGGSVVVARVWRAVVVGGLVAGSKTGRRAVVAARHVVSVDVGVGAASVAVCRAVDAGGVAGRGVAVASETIAGLGVRPARTARQASARATGRERDAAGIRDGRRVIASVASAGV